MRLKGEKPKNFGAPALFPGQSKVLEVVQNAAHSFYLIENLHPAPLYGIIA